MRTATLLGPASRLLRRVAATEYIAREGILDAGPAAGAYVWQSRAAMQLGGLRSISLAQVQAELEEVAKGIDLASHKLLLKGDPGTQQAIIRDVFPVGYFVTMPSGKEAYLPAQDLGFPGGLDALERIFKVGQEITVRIASIGRGGRENLSIKKPEYAPPERKSTD